MHRILILASLLTLTLAACGGAQTVSPTSIPPTTAPATEAVTPTAETEASTEPANADPLAAGTFSATFSGTYTFTMTGTAVVTALPTGFSLSLAGASAQGDMPPGSTLVFLLPADIAPGTYAITMPFSEAQASGGLAAHYTNVPTTSGTQSTPEAYGTVTSGSITLDSTSPVTGTFEVTFDGGISVTGAVNQAVLLSSGA